MSPVRRCPVAGPQARRGTEDGFTLLEAVVALGLIAMVITSYLGIRTAAVADGLAARNWRLAREIAEERMSELMAGAHEIPPESGVEVPLEKYEGFSYQILIGEGEIARMETDLQSRESDSGQALERNEWQRNREIYRKASERGMSWQEYQDEVAQEDYRLRLEERVPSEDEFEEVAVVVLFRRIDPEFEGQKESFMIRAKLSTLALSGRTPEQARILAESRGESLGSGGAAPLPTGGK